MATKLSPSKQDKAVFLDRDGTIIYERPGVYLKNPKKVKLYKNTLAGLKLFQKEGYKIFIISNQSGIGRGYFTEEQMLEVMSAMLKLLKGVKIEGISFCPHAPQDNCTCRKPLPKMGLDIIKGYKLDPKKCFMIGDKKSDMVFANNIGVEGILVLTANGKTQYKKYSRELKKVKICQDILGAAKYAKIISKESTL